MKLRISKVFKSRKLWGAFVATAAVVGAGLFMNSTRIDAAGCSTNDIMPCGASTPAQFITKAKANNPSDMDNIYADGRYDLPTSEYANFAAYAKAGKINPDTGNITVNGVTVGYDGQSLGRNAKSVSRPITINGKTYYESPIRLLTKNTNDAMVLFDAKGNVQTVVMNICGNPIRVTPNNPAYNCNALNMTQVDRDTFKFSSTISATKGATVTKVVYDFGNGVTRTETNPATTFEYTYPKVGNYTAKVTAFVKTPFSRGEFPITVTASCAKPVTVKEAANPKVDIDKKVDGVENKIVKVGDNFTYQLVVKNTGNVDLVNAVVSDPAPANVQFISTDKGTVAGNKLNYMIPSLKVGQSVSVNIVAKVTQYVATAIKNTACVDTPTVPGGPDDCDDATVTVEKPKVPGVTIDKKVNGVERDEVAVNEAFTYTLRVTNTGEVDLVNAVVSDKAPANVQFISTDKGTISNNTLTYTLPSFKVGTYEDIKITAKVVAYKAGDIVNTACVDTPTIPSTNPDDCDDATVTVEEPKTPQVSIDKKVDGVETKTVGVATEFTYQLVVKNTGTLDLASVVVSDKAPEGVTFVRASEGTIANGEWSTTLATLKIGESKTFTITATVPTYKAGTIKNTACVDTPTIPATNPDDCDDATVTVEEPGKVSVCDPSTGTIISVPETDADKYEDKDSPKCQKITVCRIDDKKIVTISKDEYNSNAALYAEENSSLCKPTPVTPPVTPPTPQTPQILPSTGPEAVLGGLVGSSALSYGAYSYLASRRALKKNLR